MRELTVINYYNNSQDLILKSKMNVLESLSIDSQSEATLVSQLKRQLIWLIVTGALTPGDRLPSVRVLAKHLGIHYLTVRTAYKQLEVEGILSARQGSGTRVLSYDPQHFARLAIERRSHTVGVLLPTLANPFYLSVLEGIEEIANQSSTLLFVCSFHDDHLQQARLYAQLAAKGVDGILINSQPADWLVHEGAREVNSGLPVVSMDCPGDPGDTVLIDLEAAGYLAALHLIWHGHKRIGLITLIAPVENVKPLEDGYHRALREAGIEPISELTVRVGDFGSEAGEEGARRLLGLSNPPTAIFVITDLMAAGVMRIANRYGLRIPQDISLVGFNDIPLAEQLNPPLTTVRAPAVELGRQGMRLLQQRIEGEQGAVTRTVLPVSLVIRQSCGCDVAHEE